jgi:AcrR family transcriptional regulator
VTARAISEESGANLASINYHFGSKDNLLTAAVIEGLDRWLVDISERMGELESVAPRERLSRAARTVEPGDRSRTGLAQNFMIALARAQHDTTIRKMLTDGVRRTRPAVTQLIGLGDDDTGQHAGGLLLAMFYGLLFQVLLDPELALEGIQTERALERLLSALSGP